MAQISDELAVQITNAFKLSQQDISNQDALLQGSGDVEVVLGGGVRKTVPSWDKMSNATVGTVPVERGGTGVTSIQEIREKIEVYPKSEVYTKSEVIWGTYNDSVTEASQWTSPTPVSGWYNNSGTGGRTAYRKLNGIVQLEINLAGGIQDSGTRLFTLPQQLAPKVNQFIVVVGLGLNSSLVLITPNGEVNLAAPAGGSTICGNGYYSLQ